MLQDKYSAKLASVAINEKAPTYWPGDYACTQDWFEQELDHFNDADPRTFKQRYYVSLEAGARGESCIIGPSRPHRWKPHRAAALASRRRTQPRRAPARADHA